MTIDLDRYYTPLAVANRVLERAGLELIPQVCADSTCGSGRLLEAASHVFGRVSCIGIDRDKNAIRSLRRQKPDWLLAVGDLLSKDGCRKTIAAVLKERVDLLVLNPPFSHGQKKSIEIAYNGKFLKGSVAMAHLLRSFELLRPSQGALVIAPESLLYSDTDLAGRSALMQEYRIRAILELDSCTFKGARAHATVIQISPGSARNEGATCVVDRTRSTVEVQVTRGGLPVHLMKQAGDGVPYLHSTDIRKVLAGDSWPSFLKTNDQAKGRVKGWMILLPRVGLPEVDHVRAVDIKNTVQLSDCVIGIECKSKVDAREVEGRLRDNWNDFLRLYRGTGARYVTLSRLKAWLVGKSICEGAFLPAGERLLADAIG